jgi:hypothetical protein
MEPVSILHVACKSYNDELSLTHCFFVPYLHSYDNNGG